MKKFNNNNNNNNNNNGGSIFIVLSIVFLFVFLPGVFASNLIVNQGGSGFPGDVNKTLTLAITNNESVSGLQFDISIPSGLIYKGFKTTLISSGASVVDRLQGNNLRISFLKDIPSGTSGNILDLLFNVGSLTTPAQYPLVISNVIAGSNKGIPIVMGIINNNFEVLIPCTDVDADGYAVQGGSCGPIDCNDNNSLVHPNATEFCNGLDNNCNNLIDDGFDVGVSCSSMANSCGDVNLGVKVCSLDSLTTNCNVIAPQERIGFGDICTSVPNNCGEINNGTNICAPAGIQCSAIPVADRPEKIAYLDLDKDGYGDVNSPVNATCGLPNGAVFNNLDCDVVEKSINPGALGNFSTEGQASLCDGIDNNCDGIVDDGCSVCLTDAENKAHFKTTKGTVTTLDDSNNKNVLTVRGLGYDSYEGNSQDEVYVTVVGGSRYSIKSGPIPANLTIDNIEIVSRELVPLKSNIPKKNELKVEGIKKKDTDNLFSYSGRYFSFITSFPFFGWKYTWDTKTTEGLDSEFDLSALKITTSDRIRIHLDLKSKECKEKDDGDNDGDGILDSVDPDDDNDGIPDIMDAYPKDYDNDGKSDKNDDDDDNDGKKDNKDKHKRDKNQR